MNAFLQLLTVTVGVGAGGVFARALVELIIRSDRKARLDGVQYVRTDRW